MKQSFFLILIVLLVLSCQEEKKTPNPKTIGDFTFSTSEVIAGEPFTITYNGDGELDNGFFHQVVHEKAYPADVEFKDNTASITVPDSVSLVSFYFTVDERFDINKGQGYVLNVVNADGENHVDSEAAKQFYLMNDGSFYDLTIGDSKLALSAINDALAKAPELENRWMSDHIYVSQDVGGDKAVEVKEKYLAQLASKSEYSQEDYENLYTIYSRSRDEKNSDSISNIIAEKFPKSEIAIQNTVSKFFGLENLDDREAFFKENKEAVLNSRNADYILQTIATGHYNEKNMEAFQNYFDMIESESAKASFLNSIAWARAEKGDRLNEAEEMSLQALNLVSSELKSLDGQPEYYSPNQYKQSLERSYNMYADTYALLLFKQGKVKEAITYQVKAIGEGYSPDNNERYIQYLVADSQYQKAAELSKSYISEGRATDALKEHFKTAFNKINPDGNVDEIIAEMEAKAKAKQLELIKKSMLAERAPDFTAMNLEGEEVTLSSLKGKTVILDFWATWCGPCIASFPGMQQAVTKYKDDEDVVFLFVDTFESGETRLQEVQDFITENNYDFNVLIDPKQENGSSHEIAKKYNISGIPTKVIIGPDGRMNFKDVGFSGSNDKLMAKIDSMIALLNPEESTS